MIYISQSLYRHVRTAEDLPVAGAVPLFRSGTVVPGGRYFIQPAKQTTQRSFYCEPALSPAFHQAKDF